LNYKSRTKFKFGLNSTKIAFNLLLTNSKQKIDKLMNYRIALIIISILDIQ